MGLLKNVSSKLQKAGVLQPDLQTVFVLADPKAPLSDRILCLEHLVRWIRIPLNPNLETKEMSQIQSARVKFLLMTLERNPDLKDRLSRTISSVLLETDALTLFSQLGMSRQNGFFSEAAERWSRNLIPTPNNERDLAELFGKIFDDENDADWIESLDESVASKIRDLLFVDESVRRMIETNLLDAMKSALVVLSCQIASLGMSNDVRSRSGISDVRLSAFFSITTLTAALFAENIAKETVAETLAGCRRELKSALSHLESHGVSVNIVYRLELLEQALERYEKIIKIAIFPETQAVDWKYLVSDLIRAQVASHSLKSLFADNFHLLSRKIVERTGVTGEHYITRNKSEYTRMLFSAGGGGILTVFTTLFKYLTTQLKLPLFLEGFFSWINYSGSFLIMQGLHFTLATKQPSMTAPALASKIKGIRLTSQIVEFVNEVARLTRSQFAAALGNIGLVVPSALAFNYFWISVSGSPLYSADYSQKVAASLNPFESLTVVMAALTGVLLWVASMVAGWVENWLVYRRVYEALEQNYSLRGLFGPQSGKKIAAWLQKNAGGVSGNIALGFFLAFTPVVGKFFGLPLDVRHVTLSSGSLAFAVAAGETVLTTYDILAACFGILLIGLLNFGVSFALALYTALRAHNVRNYWLIHIRSTLFGYMRRHPFAFLFPGKEFVAKEKSRKSGESNQPKI